MSGACPAEGEATRFFSELDAQWMREALLLAQQAKDLGEVPVGALVVRDGHCLGRGMNAPIAHHDPTHHAEIAAIRDASRAIQNYRLPGSTLYVTLEPCTQCFGAAVHARIERIVFAASEPRAGVTGSQLALHLESFYNHRPTVEGGLLAEQSAALLREFFQLRRSVLTEFRSPQ